MQRRTQFTLYIAATGKNREMSVETILTTISNLKINISIFKVFNIYKNKFIYYFKNTLCFHIFLKSHILKM
uniref:Uncharacterized protein n=1 Tax=Timema bartmani TaxID=61472 RepID=A0A7R9I473_9NEOP|nr:unnamed protein product [Timema bartmani]